MSHLSLLSGSTFAAVSVCVFVCCIVFYLRSCNKKQRIIAWYTQGTRFIDKMLISLFIIIIYLLLIHHFCLLLLQLSLLFITIINYCYYCYLLLLLLFSYLFVTIIYLLLFYLCSCNKEQHSMAWCTQDTSFIYKTLKFMSLFITKWMTCFSATSQCVL